MPMVNACLLDRQVMDERFQCPDPFRNTRKYRFGYTVLLDEYLRFMLARGVDTLIYPEGGRSYSGAVGEARIRRIFKETRNVQESIGDQKVISIVPISVTYTLVPEAERLIESYYSGQIIPPSSLFHDLNDADNLYRSYTPAYRTKTDFPLIRAFAEKRTPVFCVMGKPISLLDHRDITLHECFEVVKKNLIILPHHFFARLLLNDPAGLAIKWKMGGAAALLEPAVLFRDSIQNITLDEAFYDDDGLKDILHIGMEFFRYGGYISPEGDILNRSVLEYYSNKISLTL
jgi:hypothetical protein